MISMNLELFIEGVVTVNKYMPGLNLGITNSVLNLPWLSMELLVIVIIAELPIVIDSIKSLLVNPEPVRVRISPGRTSLFEMFIKDRGT